MSSARGPAEVQAWGEAAATSPELDPRLRGDLAELSDFARELGNRPAEPPGSAGPRRINADPESVEQGLAKLVLALIEVLRQLLEKQAVRRIEVGSLSEEEIERMGETFLKLEAKMAELKATFGLQDEDLALSLGPLRDLVSD